MGYTKKIYYGLSSIIIILYILAYFGVYESKDDLAELNFYFRFFIGAMLVYIFNPYLHSSKKIDQTHRYMAFSGGAAILADHCNVEYPNFIASNKEAAPLKTGFSQKEDFSVIEENDFRLMRIFPLGSRTAVATAPGTRIITPSITACPPTRIAGFIIISNLNKILKKRKVLPK